MVSSQSVSLLHTWTHTPSRHPSGQSIMSVLFALEEGWQFGAPSTKKSSASWWPPFAAKSAPLERAQWALSNGYLFASQLHVPAELLAKNWNWGSGQNLGKVDYLVHTIALCKTKKNHLPSSIRSIKSSLLYFSLHYCSSSPKKVTTSTQETQTVAHPAHSLCHPPLVPTKKPTVLIPWGATSRWSICISSFVSYSLIVQ